MLDAVCTHVASSAASRDSAVKLMTDSYQLWVAHWNLRVTFQSHIRFARKVQKYGDAFSKSSSIWWRIRLRVSTCGILHPLLIQSSIDKRWSTYLAYVLICHYDKRANIFNVPIFVNSITSLILKECVIKKPNFLISQPKHMLRVLKRTVSMRRFF